MKTILKAIDALLRDYFAPYVIMDNYGTYKLCWSMKEAETWMPYCGNECFIMETYDYCTLVARSY